MIACNQCNHHQFTVGDADQFHVPDQVHRMFGMIRRPDETANIV